MSEDPQKPPIVAPFAQPPPPASPSPQNYEGPMDRLVPTRNADAVVSYYMGLFAIIPLFGLALGSVALLKGKSGLAKVKANPEVHGKSHAMVGIGCGTIGLLFNLAIIVFVVAIFATRPK